MGEKSFTTEPDGKTLATEIIAEQGNKLEAMTSCLGSIGILLEKASFAVTEIIGVASSGLDAGKINMYAHVASDYLSQAQKAMADIAEGGLESKPQNLDALDKVYNALEDCEDLPETVQRRKNLKAYLMVDCFSEDEEESQRQWVKAETLINAYGMECERQGFIYGFNYLAGLLVPDKKIEI